MNNQKCLLLKNKQIKKQIPDLKKNNILIIYLIRHGNATNNIGIRSNDSKLTDLGILQATEINNFFKNIEFDNIYCSPLSRCIQTSNLVLTGRVILLNDLLMEKAVSICDERINKEDLNNYVKNLNNMYILNNINKDYIFKVEAQEDTQNRVFEFFNYLIKSNKNGGTVLICSHANWLNSFLNMIYPNDVNTFNNCEVKIIKLNY